MNRMSCELKVTNESTHCWENISSYITILIVIQSCYIDISKNRATEDDKSLQSKRSSDISLTSSLVLLFSIAS